MAYDQRLFMRPDGRSLGRGGRKRDTDMNSYFMSKIKSLESGMSGAASTVKQQSEQCGGDIIMDFNDDDLIKDEAEQSL